MPPGTLDTCYGEEKMVLCCFPWVILGYHLSLVFVPLCLRGEIVMLGPHHKGTKARRKNLCSTLPTQFSEEPKKLKMVKTS